MTPVRVRRPIVQQQRGRAVRPQDAPREAYEFLRTNRNPRAFAHFGRTDDALAFVNDLYQLGAARVEVDGILTAPWIIRQEGGPYADTLYVTVLDDVATAIRVMVRAAKEHPDEVDVLERDRSTVRLWWD